MITKTKIDWCDYTWNPVWGCKKGCEYCYAKKIAKRFHPDHDFKKPWFKPKRFNSSFPKEPSIIFVNSMSDPAYWERNWVKLVIGKISEHPQHKFLLLTKSPQFYDQFIWPSNCWLGTTITNQQQMDNLNNEFPDYLWPDKYNFFLSIEPLIENIELYLIPDWIIIGAESGNRKGKVIPKKGWIERLVRQSADDEWLIASVFMKESLRGIMGDNFEQQFPEELKK